MNKVILLIAVMITIFTPTASDAQRTTDQLTALYDFNESSGDVISGDGPDLLIHDTSNITWTDGGILITAPTLIESTATASNITTACMASNEITLEAWLRNTTLDASGPARIMSLSQSGNDGGNFMMGQQGDGLTVRLKTTTTDKYGNPAFTATQLLSDQTLKHIAYTRNTNGDTSLYVNGILVGVSYVDGQLSTWGDYTLTLASESLDNGQRAWLGELRLVAVYAKSLSPLEIQANYEAGEGEYIPPVIPDHNPMMPARGSWSPPTVGTLAIKYRVEHSIDGAAWYPYAIVQDTTVSMSISFFNDHRIRVAGIDVDDRQGPFSIPSDVYNSSTIYPHPPTQPIKE